MGQESGDNEQREEANPKDQNDQPVVNENAEESSTTEPQGGDNNSSVTLAPPAPPAKAKRKAERQLTKAMDSEQIPENHEPPDMSFKDFEKADKETLEKRRIVKAVRPKETEKKNPFSAALSKSGGSVFGSGFGGGFGAAAKAGGVGFGFGGASKDGLPTTKGFGGGFGSLEGGALKLQSSIFDTSAKGIGGAFSTEGGGSNATSDTKKEEAAKSFLPEDAEVVNGEEGQLCIYTTRTKAFILVDATETKEEEKEEASPISMSVPPSSKSAPAKDPNGTEVEPNAAADEEKSEVGSENKAGAEKEEEATKIEKPKIEQPMTGVRKQKWRELGIGPLRVLTKEGTTSRVVQRREAAHGGMGTKLLVNAALKKVSRLSRPSEKHVQLVTIEQPGKVSSYLFKIRSVDDAQQLHDVLKKEIATASS